jgi:predicted permease
MDIVTIITSIFIIIILGWFFRWIGFIPPEFLGPANRIVYYMAIPAMIFHFISKAPLKTQFDVMVLAITLLSVLFVFAVAWGVGLIYRLQRGQFGTDVHSFYIEWTLNQTSFHHKKTPADV